MQKEKKKVAEYDADSDAGAVLLLQLLTRAQLR